MRPTIWTKEKIQDTYDAFVKKYKRLPTQHEMYVIYNKQFPRPLSIKIATGMTQGEYFKKYYGAYAKPCRSNVYSRRTKEQWVEDFKLQYKKYGEPTEQKYNQMREHGTPNTKTLAKIMGVQTWREILSYCGFDQEQRSLFVVVDLPDDLDRLQNFYTKLKSITDHFS